MQNCKDAVRIASTVAGRISVAVIAVYVPAALMNVLTPSSLNKSLFAAWAGAALASEISPRKVAPATGVTDKYFMRSLRFTFDGFYCLKK
jgi:hypothetical protein